MNVGITFRADYYKKLAGEVTGPGTYASNLWRNLLKVNKYHKLYCLMPRTKGSKDICDKNVILTPRFPILGGKRLGRYELDIIHFGGGMPLDLANLVAFLFYPPSRMVVTMHGDLLWVLPQYMKKVSRLTVFGKRLLERIFSTRFGYFIAVSESVRRSLIKYLKVPGDRIKVVYEGVDTAFFRELQEEEKDKYRIERNIEYHYILHVSNYAPKKNFHTLINAYVELKKKGVKHKLVIAGERWNQSDVHNLIEELGIKEEVIFLGRVYPVNLVLLYNCADLFVFPSLHETFGLPILEAMACGCPVVSSNVFAIPEVAGEAALLLDNPKDASELCDKMHKLLVNQNLRTQLKMKGLKRAQQFSWEKCAKGTLAVYEEVYKMERISFTKQLLASVIRLIEGSVRKYYIKLFKHGVNEAFYNKPHQRKRLEWLKKNSKGRILEVGCSTGYILDYVGGHVGIDIDKTRLNRARKLRPYLTFQYADASNLPFKDKEFDSVLVPELLEHVPYEKAKEIVREAMRVGKQVLVTVPRREKYLMNPEHIWIPTNISILKNLLKGFNYSISSEIEDYFLAKVS